MLAFLQTYNLYIILAVATLVSCFWLIHFKAELGGIRWYTCLLTAVVHTLVGVVCVRSFAQFEGLIGPGEAGNLSLFGGVFFMPVFYYLGARAFRRDVRTVFDVFSFPLIFTLFCSRFNCLITGCCQGYQIPGTDFRYPTREAEILFYIILLHILGTRVFRKKFDGKVYPIYMLSYGIFRFVVEFFRENRHMFGFVHISHIWALLSAVIGLVLLLRLSAKGAKSGKKLVRS